MSKAPDLSSFTKEEIKSILNEIRHPLDIAVYSPGNYFNIAGIIRTAHSFLIDNIYLIDVEVENDPFYEKGTMGNHKYENIHKVTSDFFVSMIQTNNRNLISYERRPGELSTKSSWDYAYPDHPILLFGSEKSGVPDNLLSISKDVISIPMFGLNNDLNLGYSAGIAMYDWISKYYNKKDNKQ